MIRSVGFIFNRLRSAQCVTRIFMQSISDTDEEMSKTCSSEN